MSDAPDWGDGAYEVFAPSLVPAAAQLLTLAAPRAAERAIDLGCGSGNATLPLLQAGALVTAVDPSPRLLGVTTKLATAAGFTLKPVLAGAEALPLPDRGADLVVSNFAVIFCPEPAAAIGEIVRVLAPGGRALWSAWLPAGPIGELARRIRAAMTERDPARPQFAAPPEPGAPATILWHDPSTFADLVPGGLASVSVHHGVARFTASSPRAWLDEMATHHPMWLAAQREIAPPAWAQLLDDGVSVLADSVAADGTLAIESPYVIVTMRPSG